MNQLWWIPASVGGLCFLAVMTEVFIFARRRFSHPEQHEHLPGEWL